MGYKRSDLASMAPWAREQVEEGLKVSEELGGRFMEREGVRAPPKYHESAVQKAIIEWADWWPVSNCLTDAQIRRWPEIARSKVGNWLYHIPNGGYRTPIEASIFKAMGVRSGVWDLFFGVPKRCKGGKFCPGLYIETKFGSNGLTDNQREFKAKWEMLGWEFAEAYCREDAQTAIQEYFAGAMNPNWGQ